MQLIPVTTTTACQRRRVREGARGFFFVVVVVVFRRSRRRRVRERTRFFFSNLETANSSDSKTSTETSVHPRSPVRRGGHVPETGGHDPPAREVRRRRGARDPQPRGCRDGKGGGCQLDAAGPRKRRPEKARGELFARAPRGGRGGVVGRRASVGREILRRGGAPREDHAVRGAPRASAAAGGGGGAAAAAAASEADQGGAEEAAHAASRGSRAGEAGDDPAGFAGATQAQGEDLQPHARAHGHGGGGPDGDREGGARADGGARRGARGPQLGARADPRRAQGEETAQDVRGQRRVRRDARARVPDRVAEKPQAQVPRRHQRAGEPLDRYASRVRFFFSRGFSFCLSSERKKKNSPRFCVFGFPPGRAPSRNPADPKRVPAAEDTAFTMY